MITIGEDEKHIYHHSDQVHFPTFNLKIEKNSRSVNFEISIIGVRSKQEADGLLAQAKLSIDEFIAGLPQEKSTAS